jgi:DNA-binding CsgD family transcriptional regulator
MGEPDHLAEGARLLAAGDWKNARSAFEAALARGESAEALSGLGEAIFYLGDVARAVELRERAYVAFRSAGDAAAAARMALWVAMQYGAGLGSAAVASGWIGRAERLLGGVGTCAVHGWLLLRRSRSAADPAEAERLAREAIAIAHAVGDANLEIAAISQRGRALLACGRIDEGFACLDEAMAAATSGEVHVDTVGAACCDMIGACERTMEIERATQWCQVTEDFARRINFLPIFAFCRVTYASVLIAIGRWGDAERELHEALRAYDASFAMQRHLAVGKLAELRLLQGRDAEAEELLAEYAQLPGCARAVAMLHLARGDAAGAARLLRKRLAAVENDVLLSGPVLALLVESQVACGEIAGAAASAERLQAVATTTGRAAFVAAAAHAAALVACARKDASAADRFEAAIQGYASIGMPLPIARARLALARCLAGHDDRAAKEECRLAVATFEQLGAKRDLDAAADLRRRLGVGARVGARTTSTLTRREDEVLALLPLGLSNAEIGRRLYISPKTVEHHVGHILDKLGLETRAAAAAYVAKAGRKKPAVK